MKFQRLSSVTDRESQLEMEIVMSAMLESNNLEGQ